MATAKRWERLPLSAFCEVGGAKWGEGRGEVLVSPFIHCYENRDADKPVIFHTSSSARFNVYLQGRLEAA
jgi:hypothetical protein